MSVVRHPDPVAQLESEALAAFEKEEEEPVYQEEEEAQVIAASRKTVPPAVPYFGATISELHQPVEADKLSVAMRAEYEKLRTPGVQFVKKEDFLKSFRQRAEDYGITMSQKEVDKTMSRYNAAGEDSLTFAEFSKLYLKMMKW